MEQTQKLGTRKQFYEQVWLESVSSLAAWCGLSNIGLAKICKKHAMPKPSSAAHSTNRSLRVQAEQARRHSAAPQDVRAVS